MGTALGWGTFAASSLVLGALLGIARKWPPRLVGLVLAFGAGALIAAVSFQLAGACALATVAGYALAEVASSGLQAGINGFAAGALLVMLVDTMIPEATKAGRVAGNLTALGFALPAGLPGLSAGPK